LVVVLYVSALGAWMYWRFLRKKNIEVRSRAQKKLLIEHEGQTVLVDYDSLKNKVLVEFTDNGMVFKVIDGLFYDEDEEDLMAQEEVIVKGDRMSAFIGQADSGVSKL